MNVFSRYCLTFSANDCVFSLNEQQKVYFVKNAYMFTFDLKSGYVMFKKRAGMFYRVENQKAQPSGFRRHKTRAASFLNGCKNIPEKACQ